MGLRLRRSFTICKGVKVNLGKDCPSLSFGAKGLRHSIKLNEKKITPVVILNNPKGFSRDNKMAVQEYNKMIETIRGLHKYADEEIDWNIVYNSPEPFNINAIGPKAKLAKEKLNSYEPSVGEKILKFKFDKKVNQLKSEVKRAMEEDEEIYNGWRNLVDLAGSVIKGNIDSYFEVINEMKPLDDLLEFGIDFEFGANSSDAIHVEFVINSKNIIPYFSLSLTQAGKLSKQNLDQAEYHELVRDYIGSSAIRIAKDMFALLPVERSIVHVVDDLLNTQTGNREKITVLSVDFEREILKSLNFDLMEPSDALTNFKHNMNFLKTSGFQAIERV